MRLHTRAPRAYTHTNTDSHVYTHAPRHTDADPNTHHTLRCTHHRHCTTHSPHIIASAPLTAHTSSPLHHSQPSELLLTTAFPSYHFLWSVQSVCAACVALRIACVALQMEFPSSVETLITSRIDRLPVGDQLILKVAAVIASTGSFAEEQATAEIAIPHDSQPTSVRANHTSPYRTAPITPQHPDLAFLPPAQTKPFQPSPFQPNPT